MADTKQDVEMEMVGTSQRDTEQPHIHHEYTLSSQFKFMFAGYVNILLIFVPLGVLAYALEWEDSIIFSFNFLALIPLAKMLGTATEEVSLYSTQTLGALLNASFGNATEMIIAIVALSKGYVEVVQSSLLGSIISNVLFVLGFAFVVGGVKYKEQNFSMAAASTGCELLVISTISLLIPAAYVASTNDSDTILSVSHGTAILLFIIYILQLLFQLVTHRDLFEDANEAEEQPSLKLGFAIGVLVVITGVVGMSAEFMVDALEETGEAWGLTDTFMGLILLPIAGNAAEHVSAIIAASKNKMNLAVGIAVGSSIQIALFVVPLLVMIGWIIDVSMTLYFTTFETCVLFVTVILVNNTLQDGKSNWLEGAMLLVLYSIIVIAIYEYPEDD